MPTTLSQRKYDYFPQDYEPSDENWPDPNRTSLPPSAENDAHCWFTRGHYARLGRSGPWRRTSGWLWLIGPKGRLLPQ